MDHARWQERWSEGRIGFHLGSPHPVLARERATFQAARSILVPLAGKTVDLDVLAEDNRRVVANEFVEAAARAFFAERAVTPAESRTGERLQLTHGSIQYDVGDFFELDASQLGPFDAVFDRAALIAIDPADRARYAQVLASLVAPRGVVLLVTLEVDAGSGPPHLVTAADVAAIFSASFAVEQLEPLIAQDGRAERVFCLRRQG